MPTLTASVWNLDREQMENQLQGLPRFLAWCLPG